VTVGAKKKNRGTTSGGKGGEVEGQQMGKPKEYNVSQGQLTRTAGKKRRGNG